MACITCGLCIDACNDVMEKIGKPLHLIGYMALTDETRERAGQTPKSVWKHVFRPRTVLYTVLWAGVGVALVVALFLRSPIDINVTPVRNPQYVTLSDGSIRNAYDLRLRNKQGEERWFAFSATSEATFVLSLDSDAELKVLVPANETKTVRLFVTAPADSHAAEHERTDLRLWIEDVGTEAAPGTDRVHYDTVFYGKDD
ncbi:MAG: Cytochrome c oxidase accessory protein CcoG [uncultured bacterium]|nr:MAG: Cytochrome c oxidase accessory protein CcoG [uncultured bacterium]